MAVMEALRKSVRPKSPTRLDAFVAASKPKRAYNEGVLVDDWYERRLKCEQEPPPIFLPTDINCAFTERLRVNPHFPPVVEDPNPQFREPITQNPDLIFDDLIKDRFPHHHTKKPDSSLQSWIQGSQGTRSAEALKYKLNNLEGKIDLGRIPGCDRNYTSTNDLVYNHLPKPLCGPAYRTYRTKNHTFNPQPDLAICRGNLTEWGLREYLEAEWAISGKSDYARSLYQDTYIEHSPDAYPKDRKVVSSAFTKTFRTLHSK